MHLLEPEPLDVVPDAVGLVGGRGQTSSDLRLLEQPDLLGVWVGSARRPTPGWSRRGSPSRGSRAAVWGIGSVRPYTAPPCCAARSDAPRRFSIVASVMSGRTSRRFQLRGRRAVADIFAMSSARSSANGPVADGMNSSHVPGCAGSSAQRRSSSASLANRDGVGLPSASLCVSAHDEESPSAPAARLSATTRHIAAISSSVASRCQSSPSTTRRMVEWPTRKPAFTPRFPSSVSRYSPNVRQRTSTPERTLSSGMPSTLASIAVRYSTASGSIGASVKPQLPPMTDVTPWSGLGVRYGSQATWAS